MYRALLASVALLPGLAFAGGDDVPPNPFPVDPAAIIHLSPTGLESLGTAISGVLPTEIAVTGLSGEFDCDEEEEGVLTYSADDIIIKLSTEAAEITPEDGTLNVALRMTIWSDPAAINVEGTCLFDMDEACTLALPPTWLDVDLGIDLVLEQGEINAQVDHLWFSHGEFGNPIETGCILGDALETLNGYGIDLLGEILDTVLDEQIAELEVQLEEAIGGLAGALTLADDLEVMGTTLSYELAATDLEVSNSGVTLVFESSFSTPAYGTCVPQAGPYLASSHDPPAITGLIPSTTVPYHMGIVVNEDLLNQALYAAWQGGLLCLRVADLVDLELTTDYLSLVEEEAVAELWPEPIPLDVRTVPNGPPVVDFGSGPGLTAELALDVYGDELDRATRLWSNGVYADAGVGLELEDGELIIDLDFDLESHLGITVAYNEFLPSSIPEGFASLIPDLVSAALDLDALVPTIAIPAIYGITLSDLDMRAVGAEQDYLGVYAWIDPDAATPIEIGPIELSGVGCGDTGDGGEIVVPGCESEDGCLGEESGCGGEGGCSGEDGGCGGCSGEEGGDCGSCGVGSRGWRLNAWSVLSFLVPLLLISRRRR